MSTSGWQSYNGGSSASGTGSSGGTGGWKSYGGGTYTPTIMEEPTPVAPATIPPSTMSKVLSWLKKKKQPTVDFAKNVYNTNMDFMERKKIAEEQAKQQDAQKTITRSPNLESIVNNSITGGPTNLPKIQYEPKKPKINVMEKVKQLSNSLAPSVTTLAELHYGDKAFQEAEDNWLKTNNEIMTKASKETDKEKKKKLILMAQSLEPPKYEDFVPSVNKSNEQLVGEAVATGITFGAPVGGMAQKALIPAKAMTAAQVTKAAAHTAKPLLSRYLENVVKSIPDVMQYGAGYGAGTGMQENKGVAGVAGSAVVGSVEAIPFSLLAGLGSTIIEPKVFVGKLTGKSITITPQDVINYSQGKATPTQSYLIRNLPKEVASELMNTKAPVTFKIPDYLGVKVEPSWLAGKLGEKPSGSVIKTSKGDISVGVEEPLPVGPGAKRVEAGKAVAPPAKGVAKTNQVKPLSAPTTPTKAPTVVVPTPATPTAVTPQKYTLSYPETVTQESVAGKDITEKKIILQTDQQEGKSITPTALENASITLNKTKLLQMQTYSPEFKAAPVLTAAKNEEGNMMLNFRGEKTVLSIKPEAIGVPADKLVEGDTISLKGIKEEPGKVPFIKDETGAIIASSEAATLPAKKSVPEQINYGEKRPRQVKIEPKSAIDEKGKLTVSETPISRREIVDEIKKYYSATVRPYNKQKSRGALGYFKIHPEVTRLKSIADVETAVHEVVGHLVAKRYAGKVPKDILGSELVPKEYAEEIATFASSPGKSGSVYSEGFAEFMRAYVTQREYAKANAPEYFKYFENTFLKNNPENKPLLDALTESWREYTSGSSLERGLAQTQWNEPSDTTPIRTKIQNTLNNWYTGVVDSKYYGRLFEKIVKEAGGDPEKFKFFEMMQNSAGAPGRADIFLTKRTFDPPPGEAGTGAKVNFTGESLVDAVTDLKTPKEEELWNTYANAVRTLQNTKKPTGIKPSDAKQIIEDLDKAYPKFKEVTRRVHEFDARLFKYFRDAGMITQKGYNMIMENGGGAYTPLYRVMEEVSKKTGSAVKTANPVKKRTGSERPIVPVLESIVKNVYTIMTAVEKNNQRLRIAQIAREVPGLGEEIEFVKAGMAKVATVDLSAEAIKKIGLPPEMMGEELGSVIESLGTVPVFRQSNMPPEVNTHSYFVNGKRKWMRLSDGLYSLLENTSMEQLNMLEVGLQRAASLLRVGVTTSVPFTFRNFLRDVQGRIFNSILVGNPIKSMYQSIRGIIHAKSDAEMLTLTRLGEGLYAHPASYDRATMQKTVGDIVGRRLAPKEWLGAVAKALIKWGEYVESGTRIGEFEASLKGSKMWDDINHAGFLARESTTDFQRAGAAPGVRKAKAMAAFWNTSLQGFDRTIRAAKDNPKQFSLKGLLWLTVPSILLWYVNRDNENYYKQPAYLRENYWLIPIKNGEYFIPVPKTFLPGIFFGSGAETALNIAYGKDPKAMDDWIMAMIATLPGAPLPTGALVIIEEIFDKRVFGWKPIVGERLKGVAASEQYQSYTPELYKWIGKVTGLSPVRVQHVLEGLTGTGGKDIVSTLSAPLAPDKPKEVTSLPILRSLLVGPATGSKNAYVQDLYDKSEKVDKTAATLNKMLKEGKTKQAEEYYNKSKLKDYLRITDNETFGNSFSPYMTMISDAGKEREAVNNSTVLSKDEKKARTTEIDTGIDLLVKFLLNAKSEGNQ